MQNHICCKLSRIRRYHQPANSPSLAPCDFWLFDLIKQNLSDDDSSQSLHRAINHTFDRQKGLSINGVERMQIIKETTLNI